MRQFIRLDVPNAIDIRVTGIADNVLVIDNTPGIDDRVAGVDELVAGIDDRVKDVNGKAEVVDDKLAMVIDDAQYIFNQPSTIVQLPTGLDVKETRGVMQHQQTADDVDQVKRSWSPNRIHTYMQAQPFT